jgi:hypothetical protein
MKERTSTYNELIRELCVVSVYENAYETTRYTTAMKRVEQT